MLLWVFWLGLKKLIQKLKIRFLVHEMFLGLSIPTTSCSPPSSQIVKSFPKHVEVIKSNLLLLENLVGA